MIGVTIAEKGTKNRAITDTNGNYTLQVEGRNPVLIVSYVGFTEQVIKSSKTKCNANVKRNVIF